ncbi:MAG: DUF86 domain-containing protein [Chloroflexota bacterium]|nr:DUF86 domain-containing protein [Chloroflexota bacterium]
MLSTCELILEHTAGRSFDDYDGDPFFRARVEYCFEIIGEALRRIERRDPTTAALIPDHREIVDFRNVLAHGYDIVDNDDVWSFVKNDLPLLRERLRALLAGLDRPGEFGTKPGREPSS